jgi:hypothetical protein
LESFTSGWPTIRELRVSVSLTMATSVDDVTDILRGNELADHAFE